MIVLFLEFLKCNFLGSRLKNDDSMAVNWGQRQKQYESKTKYGTKRLY